MKIAPIVTAGMICCVAMGCSSLPRINSNEEKAVSRIKTEVVSTKSISITNVTLAATSNSVEVRGEIVRQPGRDVPQYADLHITAYAPDKTVIMRVPARYSWYEPMGRERQLRRTISFSQTVKVAPSNIARVRIEYSDRHDNLF